jgi:hypothetical protein
LNVNRLYGVISQKTVTFILSHDLYYCLHVWCVPCHHGMARPQGGDGGDALQVWSKQSRTADTGWTSSLGVGRGANNSPPKKICLLRKITRSFGPGRIPWINDLSERKWIWDLLLGTS